MSSLTHGAEMQLAESEPANFPTIEGAEEFTKMVHTLIRVDAAVGTELEYTRPRPWLCHMGFHSWLELQPSAAQKQELRQLISHGEGNLNSLGGRDSDVLDRVCTKCFDPENRMSQYLTALRRARGL